MGWRSWKNGLRSLKKKMRQVGRSSQRILWRQSINKFEFVLFSFFQTVGIHLGGFLSLPESELGASSIAHDMCNLEGEDYVMAALEDWIAFFEEKGCEEWAGVADLRISLKDAYTGVAIRLRTGSERRRRQCCARHWRWGRS